MEKNLLTFYLISLFLDSSTSSLQVGGVKVKFSKYELHQFLKNTLFVINLSS
jgi:hypothetical protein